MTNRAERGESQRYIVNLTLYISIYLSIHIVIFIYVSHMCRYRGTYKTKEEVEKPPVHTHPCNLTRTAVPVSFPAMKVLSNTLSPRPRQ